MSTLSNSTFISIIPPVLNMHFSKSLQSASPGILKITNNQEISVAIRIKCSSNRLYLIKPTSLVLKPKENSNIIVKSKIKSDLEIENCKHELIIQSMKMKLEQNQDNIKEILPAFDLKENEENISVMNVKIEYLMSKPNEKNNENESLSSLKSNTDSKLQENSLSNPPNKIELTEQKLSISKKEKENSKTFKETPLLKNNENENLNPFSPIFIKARNTLINANFDKNEMLIDKTPSPRFPNSFESNSKIKFTKSNTKSRKIAIKKKYYHLIEDYLILERDYKNLISKINENKKLNNNNLIHKEPVDKKLKCDIFSVSKTVFFALLFLLLGLFSLQYNN